MKCKKAGEGEKAVKPFNYTKIEWTAASILAFMARNEHRQRLSTFLPNLGSVFCTSGLDNAIYRPDTPKIHLLFGPDIRLVTVIELGFKNGLYDMLSIIRNPYGAFAYRAHIIYGLAQLALPPSPSPNPNPSPDGISSASATPVPAARADFPFPERPPTLPLRPLISAKPITSIGLPADDQLVRTYCECVVARSDGGTGTGGD
jgi:hypothetical protein